MKNSLFATKANTFSFFNLKKECNLEQLHKKKMFEFSLYWFLCLLLLSFLCRPDSTIYVFFKL